ncbi:Noc2-domain-containing protein [Tuber magnatum]|uniref:Noc2-domain-containing protein n=1 Tax=Tuber magnatum TaxID=42249 RepID=A0A317SZY6_9PEZI|nr:Noc2-domain-containing protein [Tuber magnatum]
MGRMKKSTRKFETKHLKKTLEDRKAHAKVKQRHRLAEKRKKRRADESTDKDAEEEIDKAKRRDGDVELFKDMSVEQFFQGGFEVPETEKQKERKKELKRKREEGENKDNSEGEGEEEGESDDELETHKADLAALAEKDPEFFKYLQENDSELLDFTAAERDDLSGIDIMSEGESEDEAPKRKKRDLRRGEDKESTHKDSLGSSIEVTLKDVETWKKALVEEKSLRSLKKVVLAFRAAAHVNDIGDSNNGYKYSITDANVYHELLVLALKHVPDILNHHLPARESASGKIRIASDTKKYRSMSPLLKSHSASLLHLLPTLTDAPTQKLLLNSTVSLVPYFLSFRKFLKAYIKAVIDIWAANSSDESTRITAFLVVRKAAVVGDDGLKEMCLKALYAGFIRASRQTSGYTMQGINLMKNSAREVLGLNSMDKVGYSAGFGYIRQLAVHLRNSIINNSKDSYKTVYNWQYVHSLDFWSRVLSTHCNGLKEAEAGKVSPLRPLIYPLIQVTLGAIKLIPTAQYFPLRFYLLRSLLRLSRATGVYIPLASLLFEVLSSTIFKKKPKPSTLRPLDFSTTIRAPKSYLPTKAYQDGVGDQVVELLSEFFALHAKSIAFPELAIPAIVHAKRWIKKSPVVNLNNALNMFVGKLEMNSTWVQERRNKVEFALNKIDLADKFLNDIAWEKTPFGAYVFSQRKVREEKRKMVEESLRQEKAERRSGGDGDNESGDEEGHLSAEEEQSEDEDMGDIEGEDEGEDVSDDGA